MTVSEDELAPLVALERACQNAEDWAHYCQADIDRGCAASDMTHARVHLKAILTTLKAAIARAEDALG